ncbi:MAG: hypothetical protein LBR17_01510 [Bacteroidales bacterium]|jgi:hypothetical protein|nr:hypothetical protein [Bacteroidales bacterium]
MKNIFLIIVLVFCTATMFAQPTPGGRPDDGGAGSHEDTQMPITTATALLLCFGSGYVIIKHHIRKKN